MGKVKRFIEGTAVSKRPSNQMKTVELNTSRAQ